MHAAAQSEVRHQPSTQLYIHIQEKHTYKCKNIFTKMSKDISVKKNRNKVKVQHACRQRQGMIACNNECTNSIYTSVKTFSLKCQRTCMQAKAGDDSM